MKALQLIAVLLLGLVLTGPLAAQGKAKYRARLTTGLARMGEKLGILVEVENADRAEILTVPRVKGLKLGGPGRPSTREEYHTSPGRRIVTRTVTWTILIQPMEIGDYDIPGIELDVDGTRVTTGTMRLKVVKDMRGAELGFFDVEVSPDEVVEGQPIVLEMTFGWDEGIQDRVNLANLILPWWGRLPELLELESPPTLSANEVQINLNGRGDIVVEEIPAMTRDGRKFRAFRLKRAFLPTRPRKVDLPQPFLEFGQREQQGFFSNRSKRETYFVSGEAVSISVAALPEEGRPLDYTGAIGRLKVRAEAEPRDVDVGDSIKLSVTYTGNGNNQFYDPPDLSRDDAFEGFRVFGSVTKNKSLSRHEVVYDLAPRTDAEEVIPPVRLPVFDPAASEYVYLETEPIPIRVRPLEAPVTLTAEDEGDQFAKDIVDVASVLPGDTGRGRSTAPGPLALGLFAGGVVFIWLALRTTVRRRLGNPDAPLERRRRAALKALSRELAGVNDPSAALRALLRFLSARTREPEWAWVGRDPVEHLESDLTEGGKELADAIARLERATYAPAAGSNGDGIPKRDELMTLAGRLVQGGL